MQAGRKETKDKSRQEEPGMMQLCRNEFIEAFALTLDFLEMEFKNTLANHNKRTGLIAAQIGRAMGMSDADVFDLSAYAMLHDNGITHMCYNIFAAGGGNKMDCMTAHCIRGEKNLAAFPFLQPRKNVIQYHHEAFDGSGYFGVSGDDIPLFSQIIALAEPLETAYSAGESQEEIIMRIMEESGRKYAPALVEAFRSAADAVSFWLSLDLRFLDSELKRHIPTYSLTVDLKELLPVSAIMSEIIDLKSPFTANHSRGLSEKNAIMCDYYGFSENKKTKMLIATDLHDIGKLAIPNYILDKAGKLTDSEFHQIQAHVFYTRKVIESVRGFEDIAQWASNHHEKLDGKGYPFGLSADELSFESRLIGCLDIYQALTEDRPYREGLSHAAACKIMDDMVAQNKISREITADVKAVLG